MVDQTWDISLGEEAFNEQYVYTFAHLPKLSEELNQLGHQSLSGICTEIFQ